MMSHYTENCDDDFKLPSQIKEVLPWKRQQ